MQVEVVSWCPSFVTVRCSRHSSVPVSLPAQTVMGRSGGGGCGGTLRRICSLLPAAILLFLCAALALAGAPVSVTTLAITPCGHGFEVDASSLRAECDGTWNAITERRSSGLSFQPSPDDGWCCVRLGSRRRPRRLGDGNVAISRPPPQRCADGIAIILSIFVFQRS